MRGRDRLRVRERFSATNFSQGCISKRTGEQVGEERCHDERGMEEIIEVVRSNCQDVLVQERCFWADGGAERRWLCGARECSMISTIVKPLSAQKFCVADQLACVSRCQPQHVFFLFGLFD